MRVAGLLPDDEQALVIVRPDGKTMAREHRTNIDRQRAVAWRYIGRRNRGTGWPRGVYRGEYRLVRSGRLLLRRFVRVRVE